MATLAFSLAGQVAGGFLGGPIGATVGRALGALAGSVVDDALFGDSSEAAQTGRDVRLQSSSEGGAIPRIYGWNRVGGNIIWATELERITAQSSGAKGFGQAEEEQQQDAIVANFAVAFCEGEVTHLGRVWADGELLDLNGVNARFYNGSETQLADSLISAKQGAAKTPAYRGLSYMVFERLPLEPYGNRIPSISVELCRVSGDLESDIRAVTLIPGATEFGYDPTPRVRIVSPGKVVGENTHLAAQASDWSLSIDELQAMCPNLEHVAIVVGWFGDDLNCGACTMQPKVEADDRVINGVDWQVGGLGRGDVAVVTQHNGGPAYGGTPSDNAVLAAIADLKQRGLKVTLYPLIFMDIASDNVLTDPYTQLTGQSAYPWRGRITCDPAPVLSGTPDNSVAIDAEISEFIGGASVGDFAASGDTIAYSGPANWGYRRMVLHYAHLCELAGGVDAFLLGSELRGLTSLRRSAVEFPFVEALTDLAADVKSIFTGSTQVTYAADWTEYSGYQPADAPGDKIFHLDPLWADANVDAIGIDNYMPIADWRDSSGHLDSSDALSIYDLDYLQSNIAGGEGFDWYYASDADRDAQTRTEITDGTHSEPWVWRYKDIVSFWSNSHYNRIGGVRQASPTAWVPESRPIWLTELGCGAVDKGANAPNAFADPKSAEDARPYYSSGSPDTLMQRQFLRAHHQYWRTDAPDFEDAQNPASSVYSGSMLDTDRMYLWTWDARPFPAFPNLRDVWSDGANYATGHWLNGRLGAQSAAEMLAMIAQDYDTTIAAGYSGSIKVEGLQIEGLTAMRGAIESLLEAADINILDRPQGLVAIRAGTDIEVSLSVEDCVPVDDTIVERKRPDNSAAIGQLGLSYLDRQRAYMSGTASAMALSGTGATAANSGLVIEPSTARAVAEQVLGRLTRDDDTLEFSMPPSQLALEVGDVVSLDGQDDGPFVITAIRDAAARRVSARALANNGVFALSSDAENDTAFGSAAMGVPYALAAHLPPPTDGFGSSRMFVGAVADPWPGEVTIKDATTSTQLTRVTQSATLGVLTAELEHAGSQMWDRVSTLSIELYDGHLASIDEFSVLAGSNRAAVQRDDGSWEIVGFANAEMTGETTYELTNLLRGVGGTGNQDQTISAGQHFMLLDSKIAQVDVSEELLGGSFDLLTFAGTSDTTGTEFIAELGMSAVLPLAPAHLAATRDTVTGDISLNWVRRARRNGNSWVATEIPLDLTPEGYSIEIFDGVNLKRTITAETSSAIYANGEQISDFGGLPSSFTFTIAQTSPVFGTGHLAQGTFNG